jgi:hypothetical protein
MVAHKIRLGMRLSLDLGRIQKTVDPDVLGFLAESTTWQGDIQKINYSSFINHC